MARQDWSAWQARFDYERVALGCASLADFCQTHGLPYETARKHIRVRSIDPSETAVEPPIPAPKSAARAQAKPPAERAKPKPVAKPKPSPRKRSAETPANAEGADKPKTRKLPDHTQSGHAGVVVPFSAHSAQSSKSAQSAQSNSAQSAQRTPRVPLPPGPTAPRSNRGRPYRNKEPDQSNQESVLRMSCGAKTRGGKGFCRLPAGYDTDHLGTGRCRFHGGRSTGPKNPHKAYGNKHNLKHGLYAASYFPEEVELLKQIENNPLDMNPEILDLKVRIVRAGAAERALLAQKARIEEAVAALDAEEIDDEDEDDPNHIAAKRAHQDLEVVEARLDLARKAEARYRTSLSLMISRQAMLQKTLTQPDMIRAVYSQRAEQGLSAVEAGRLLEMSGVPIPKVLGMEIAAELKLGDAGGDGQDAFDDEVLDAEFSAAATEADAQERVWLPERLAEISSIKASFEEGGASDGPGVEFDHGMFDAEDLGDEVGLEE